ncbi:MAG: outer membrane beta-barrel protein [Ignavibacteriales bacterium]|nr:outer membrane beta-barrel protein [Ignavibacteriales bacterium]
MKSFKNLIAFSIIFLLSSSIFAQTTVMIGPRVTGNFNIYNQKGLTGTWNGVGVGFGPTVDVTFGKHIGIMVNLTAFDMRNFSNSQTQGNTTQDQSLTLSYLALDPMFKADFSGFYMVAGPSLGIKLNSSGETTVTVTGQAPQINPINIETKSLRFDIAVGTGYTFKLSSDMGLGTDFMAYIPLTDTYNTPGISNSIFSMKLGVSLKFKI